MTPTPIDLLLEAGRRGFKIEAHGDKLHITPQCPSEFADLVRAHKQRLLALLALPFVMVRSQARDGEILFFCGDDQTRAALVEAGAAEWSIYTKQELKILCEQNRVSPISAAELQKIHQIKRTFYGRITE
jgi:hypothetical protein